jgi:hypothetical protein
MMEKLIEFLKDITSGTPQFRITESVNAESPSYSHYNQSDLQDDLAGIVTEGVEHKTLRTDDAVNTLCAGDVIYSLISGTAAIVGRERQGFLFTQNYVRLVPDSRVDPKFLVYLLNEDRDIRRQLAVRLQGSMVVKYTVGQLRGLTVSKWPDLERQKIIGKIYLMQLHLEALKKRTAERETLLRLRALEEVRK